jgi:hypothetical protein
MFALAGSREWVNAKPRVDASLVHFPNGLSSFDACQHLLVSALRILIIEAGSYCAGQLERRETLAITTVTLNHPTASNGVLPN